ncbi:hypothetical protein AVEN_34559-1 [Araneus ventricosus]|uniref:Uncharacterized protein n=1 Tax=Araneus ventricosus TaxID=182803 RepID=A0A4Y2B0J2_ARAVE|nr:hypothetical protein AVEN_34559-1 [Araneus ventricosus]
MDFTTSAPDDVERIREEKEEKNIYIEPFCNHLLTEPLFTSGTAKHPPVTVVITFLNILVFRCCISFHTSSPLLRHE